FIGLIKMMIAPIIFCTIVAGVAGMGNMKQVGRVGGKALLCFEIFTTLAMIIGLGLMSFYHPDGITLSTPTANVDLSAIKSKAEHVQGTNSVDFLMNIIPTTLVGAFSNGEILQVLLIAVLFAAALPSLGERGKQMVNFLDLFAHILFKMIDNITKLAPIGAFGAMASTVGKYGVVSLGNLGGVLVAFYAICLFFILAVLFPIMHFYCKLSLWKFIKFIKEEIFIVLGTASSESTLPRIMEKLEIMGCSKSVVGMVIPTGYSFNLIGSAIYFTVGALFISYVTGTPFTVGQELTLLGVLLVASKGAAGVTGSSFIVLTATLSSMKIIPQQNLDIALTMLYSIDYFLVGRAITNLVGNAITTIIVAKWENAIDYETATKMLDEGSPEL
ncbi:MAG: cation:dicarboxylase symporter family transporter, partial [Pseudomonadota bacterium]